MRPRTVLSSLSIAIIALAVLGIPRAASDPAACFRAAGTPSDLDLAEGAIAAAVHGRDLVLVDGGGGTDRFRLNAAGGLIRHASSRPGSGTAYVTDARGADTVVLVAEGGTERIGADGEASHPAIGPGGAVAWAEDLGRLRLRSPGGRVRTLAAPRTSRAVFSPIFLGPGRLAAVVEETFGGVHDTGLDNMFGMDRATGRWERLTAFRAGADRWSAIRTPVVGRDGTVWFVRVSGRASATRRPAFELWRLDAGRAARVRSLPGEAYLAGAVDGTLLWNVYDREASAWRLLLGGPAGAELLGCGAAMVEPRSVADPDLAVEAETPVLEDQGSAVPAPEDGALGIVVGDFETRGAAEDVAEEIGTVARAVGHGGAPAAVGPDRFAAAIPLGGDVDVVEALDGFRQDHPEYADRSWIAVLRAPGEEPG
jgi:hypothetical protein